MAETVLVCHDTHTSSETTSDGKSWIDYWKEMKNQEPPTVCPCCNEEATADNPMVGAHVVKVSEISNASRPHYITPTCDSCNKKYKERMATIKEFLVSIDALCKI